MKGLMRRGSAAALGIAIILVSALVTLYAAGHDKTKILAALTIAVCVTVAVYRSRWRWALPYVPLALIPVPALTYSKIGPISIAYLVPLWVIVSVYCIIATVPKESRANYGVLFAIVALGAWSIATAATGGGGSVMGGIESVLVWIGALVFGARAAAQKQRLIAMSEFLFPLALLAIVEIFVGRGEYSRLIGASNYTNLSDVGDAERSLSTFGHPLVAGACLSVGGLLALPTGRRGRVLGAVVLIGAIATVSRSSLLAIAAGIIVLVVIHRDKLRARSIAAAACVAVAVVAVGYVVPATRDSFGSRVGSYTSQSESIRDNSVTIFRGDLRERSSALLLGGGVGESGLYIKSIGGNFGFPVFDNQYISGSFDYGLVPFGLFLVAVIAALFASPDTSRKQGLAAVVAAFVVIYFFDGFGWPAVAFILFYALGIATSVPVAVRDAEGARSIAH